MAQKKQNLVEEALLQMENLKEAVTENAKGILASTMKEEISELVKESLNEEEIEDEVSVEAMEGEKMEEGDDMEKSVKHETKEQDEEWQTNKTQWKADNPNETLKQKKLLYIKGLIDNLPWEDKVEQGYQQNAEQGEETLFNKLKKE